DLEAFRAATPPARRNLTVVARLAPNATFERLQAYLAAFSTRYQADNPTLHGRSTWIARPLRGELVGEARGALIGVGAAAALLVLIVMANIGGLAAARGVTLRREVAVRAALGAGNGRLIVDRLTECVALATIGAGAGVGLAAGVLTMIRALQRDFLARMA